MKFFPYLTIGILWQCNAFATFESFAENLVGYSQIRSNSPQLAIEISGAFTDGIADSGAAKLYDTRYTGQAYSLGVFPFGGKAFLRLGGLGSLTSYQQEDSSANATTKSQRSQFDLSTDVNLQLQNELEFLASIKFLYLSPFEEKTEQQFVSSTRTLERVMLWVPRFGFVKRNSTFVGGFYYSMSAKTKRNFSSIASDGSQIEDSATTFLEPRFGGFVNVKFSQYNLFFEGQFAQASESGSKSTEGVDVYRDYYRIASELTYLYGNPNFRLSILYKTASYSEQEFMMSENIPLLQASIAVDFQNGGGGKRYLSFGYAQAWDDQSQEQFNAKLIYKTYIVRYGLEFLF